VQYCVWVFVTKSSCSVLGTLKTPDWKRRDLKSMESVTIFKSKSYGAEIKTVYGGMVATLKASVHQGMAASAVALRDEFCC